MLPKKLFNTLRNVLEAVVASKITTSSEEYGLLPLKQI
jgi:hypothetical protein